MSKNYKIAEQHETVINFLRSAGYTIITDKCSEGWIRWKDTSYEGVIRITAAGDWTLVGDRLRNFDRCANAEFEILLRDISDRVLTKAFNTLNVELG
jgi:hypothetical protein